MATTISITLVRCADGSVDLDATMELAKATVLDYVAQREVEEAEIGSAIHAIFDKYRGASINMPAIQSIVLQSLGASPETFKVLSEKVVEYLRNHSGERGTAQFVISRGRGGGVKRWADQPA